jgi:glutamate-1-semialdehyde 2,1-aminomutase
VPAATAADTIVVPYGDVAAVEQAFAEHEIAAIITEGAPANMGVVPPAPRFNQRLSGIAASHGALLILDEVLTGFRVSERGWWGIEGQIEGWAPDLLTFGKVIGGGLPLAAVGGRAEVMDLLAPAGPVYQAGTLSGNPAATAAGLATLSHCTAETYRILDENARTVAAIVDSALTRAGVAHTIQSAGNLFSVFFTEGTVRSFDDAKSQDTAAFARFFHSMLDQGVWLPPSAFEAWFVSTAMTSADFDAIESAAGTAAMAAAATG